MDRILAINLEIADLQERINALLIEQRTLLQREEKQPKKVNNPKRKRRTKAEMEEDVTSAIRYLLDEEYNGATQSGAEKRFKLPAGILSKGKWANLIETYRKMR
jgi:hypothetical protein